MNLTSLLIVVALFGQVQPPPGAFPADAERDYGWMIDPDDGALVYIVQLSPTKAAYMVENRQEKFSSMPPALVGRATRIVIRIGTEVLPKTPSLTEIARMPLNSQVDLSAMGPGKFSDIDSQQVRNVQQGSPTMPNFGVNPPTGSNDPASFAPTLPNSLRDQANQFAQGARGAAADASSAFAERMRTQNGSQALPSTGLPNASTAGTKFMDTAPSTDLSGQAGSQLPNTSTNLQGGGGSSLLPNSATSRPGALANRSLGGLDGWQGQNGPQQSAPTTATNPNNTPGGYPGQAYASGPGYSPLDNSSQAPRTTPGFGAPNGFQPPTRSLAQTMNQGQLANETRQRQLGGYASTAGPANSNGGYGNAGPGYAGGGYGGGSYSANGNVYNRGNRQPGGGGYGQPAARLATNTPNAQPESASELELKKMNDKLEKVLGTEKNAGGSQASSGDLAAGQATGKDSKTQQKKDANTYITVFFIISLVVNVYLGHLIRKLLDRYRSLLTSVRAQTA